MKDKQPKKDFDVAKRNQEAKEYYDGKVNKGSDSGSADKDSGLPDVHS